MNHAGLLILALAALCGVPAQSRAETGAALRLRFEQSIAVGSTWLPAGEYDIRVLPTTSDQPLLQVREVADGSSVLVPVMRVAGGNNEVSGRTQAVVEVRDGRPFLKQIWFAGRVEGYQVLSSRSAH